MSCGCQKKKNKHGKGKNLSSPATELEKDFFSQVDGELVPLCLRPDVELPILFPAAVTGGRDLVVLPSGIDGFKGVDNVTRSGNIPVSTRDILMRAYPNLFECVEQSVEA